MGRVHVLGSLNVDLVTRVRRLPRPGETVAGDDLQRNPGGKGANQAVAAARAGAAVRMIGACGADEGGDVVLDALARDGIDVSGVRRLPTYLPGPRHPGRGPRGERDRSLGRGPLPAGAVRRHGLARWDHDRRRPAAAAGGPAGRHPRRRPRGPRHRGDRRAQRRTPRRARTRPARRRRPARRQRARGPCGARGRPRPRWRARRRARRPGERRRGRTLSRRAMCHPPSPAGRSGAR